MSLRLTITSLAFAGAMLLPAPVFAYTSPGNPAGYVNDFAHVLSPQTVQALETELSAFEASTSNQIAVVTVPDMDGEYVENYAVKLFEEWGIGGAEKDNGVLLLVAVEEHKLRIEVGYGLEGALPDSIAQSILNNDMTPLLKEGKYDEAVVQGVSSIMLATQNEYVAEEKKSKFSLSGNALEAILVFAFIALQWLAAIFARSKSWWLGGIVGGAIGVVASLWFGFLLLWGGILTAVLVAAGLFLDYFVSRAYTAHKAAGDHIPWWAGGGVGSGSSRNSSSGGFGGFGGGSSGGGGASGGW